jgi:hypothetical protein
MIEGLKNAPSTKRNDISTTLQSDQTIEKVAIAGANAIQHLIAERDSLRGRAHIQEGEITVLRSANEDLTRHLMLIRDHYVGLATGVITELNQMDQLFQLALRKAQEQTTEPARVHHLSPNGERADVH